MIRYKEKDLLTVEKGIIVHGVNCQGVMGAGVAKSLRTKYPQIFESYKEAVGQATKFSDLLGKFTVTKINEDLYILNAFTQENYGRDGRRYVSYDAVDEVFRRILNWKLQNVGDLDLYFPKIGCNLGGGSWCIIERIINECLHDADDEVGYCCLI